MKYALSTLGTLLTALACTACCWLPAVLGATAVSAFSFLHRWQPFLLTFTAVQLGVGFYLAYRPNTKHVCTRNCHHGDFALKRKVNIGVMWAVALFVIALNLWNFRSHAVEHVEEHKAAPATANLSSQRVQDYTLKLKGMHCESCAQKIEKSLYEVRGVLKAKVDFDQKKAVVSADPSTLRRDDLKRVVEEAGYTAELVSAQPSPPDKMVP
ncbi:MAG: heavy-metal-associated domain-containing protein [Fimbriimonadia bacterium]|nr:heavy-metal-associated domain-containing protein [Fimbriimonadia bacterium]